MAVALACALLSWPSVPFPGISLLALRIPGTLYLLLLFVFPQQHLKWGVVLKRLRTFSMGTPLSSSVYRAELKVSLVLTVCQT